jgi:nucleoid-associated protein YgaU
MTAISIGRIGVPYLALAATCGAAVAVGLIQMRQQSAPEARAAMAAAAVPAPAPQAQDQASHALAAVQAEANAVAAAPAASPRAPDVEETVPAFDVARIEGTGDAVIAGRAAPGATVELMRNGESLDRAVADQSGQFVMIPPRLPPGNYALTLRSREPDGKETLSKQSVAVALAEAAPGSGAVQAHADLPSNAGDAAGKAAQPGLQLAKQQDAAVSTAAARSDGGPSAAATPPRKSTTTVTRGDSLWRISRLTYGEGTRYSLVYRANRDRIRNPDRIYPGQVFVLPLKEH